MYDQYDWGSKQENSKSRKDLNSDLDHLSLQGLNPQSEEKSNFESTKELESQTKNFQDDEMIDVKKWILKNKDLILSSNN